MDILFQSDYQTVSYYLADSKPEKSNDVSCFDVVYCGCSILVEVIFVKFANRRVQLMTRTTQHTLISLPRD